MYCLPTASAINKIIIKALGINNANEFKKWILLNHPDKIKYNEQNPASKQQLDLYKRVLGYYTGSNRGADLF